MSFHVISKKENYDIDESEKKFTQEEIGDMLDRTINVSILSRIYEEKIINEEQYHRLLEKIETFYKWFTITLMLSTQLIEVKKLSFSFKKLILLLRWLYNYIYTVFYIRIYMLESISKNLL